MPHPTVSAALTTALAELPRIRDNLRGLSSDITELLALGLQEVRAMESIALALGTLEVAHAHASIAGGRTWTTRRCHLRGKLDTAGR